MTTINRCRKLVAFGLLFLVAGTAHASALWVSCGAAKGLNSISAALKFVQGSESHGPTTINISGACNENVVIQGIDRLTLQAVGNASINDQSAGSLSTVSIIDSRDVSINGFTINGGGDGVDCAEGSVCRLNGTTVQGAVNGYGVGAFFSQFFIDGGSLQNNYVGLAAINGASGRVTNMTIQNNSTGIEIRTHSFVNAGATITANTAGGVYVHDSGTLSCPGCQITGNGGIGLTLSRDSSADIYSAFAITGNSGGGVLLTEESSVEFPNPTGTVAGNTGGKPGVYDVYCASSHTTARNATTNIGPGTTNCTQPSP